MDKRKTEIQPNQAKVVFNEKKIENILTKSENYWNKLLNDQKDLLATTCNVKLCPIEEDKFFEFTKNISISTLLSGKMNELNDGKIWINVADPSNLCWGLNYEKRNKINLINFYGSLEAAAQMNWKRPFSELEELNENFVKENTQPSLCDKNIEKETNIYEGQDALNRLSVVVDTSDPEFSSIFECLILIVSNGLYLFIIFEDPVVTENWTIAFKILLKAQNLSYRGVKDEYLPKKREFVKEIARDKEIFKEFKKRKYLIWINDSEIDSCVYREIKFMFWSRTSELSSFFVFDMRKSFSELAEKYFLFIKNENYINKAILTNFFSFFEISKFFFVFRSFFDISTELKGLYLITESEKDENYKFLNAKDQTFWARRNKIINRYKKMDKIEAKNVFDYVIHSMFESKNKVLRALKLLQLQKLDLRVQLIEILTPRWKKRGKRGGKRAKRKQVHQNQIQEKIVTKTTVSVLKLLMFEDTRPDLIPDYLKKKKEDDNDDKRQGCCCLIT